jgi:uncharacterized membrane protein
MKKKFAAIEKMLVASVVFTMMLLVVRIIFTGNLTYGFYIWNTFLAIVPLIFSRILIRQQKISIKVFLLIAGWLLFFPNAPYIITDLIHFERRESSLKWFDILLVTSATWNGLILGFASLLQIELFLSVHLKIKWVNSIVFVSLILCGYGIYLGRFLRFNSWDIIVDPYFLFTTLIHQLLHPIYYFKVWIFSLSFSMFLWIIYFTIKQLPRLYERGS